ncbi:MAG: hypothetical protein AAFV43_14615 [Planctomycetota bacterium]
MSDATPPTTSRWLPAWWLSLGAHSLLVGTAAWWGGAERGVLPGEPDREIGVVLREPAVEPIPSEHEGEQAVEAPAPTPTIDVSMIAPVAAPSPLISDLLAELTAEPRAAVAAPAASASSGGRGKARLPYGHTRVSVFGLEASGGRFVYAFDRSMSMRGAPLRAAKRELLGSLDALRDVHRFQILFFNHAVSAFDLSGGRSRVAYATDDNKRRAQTYVAGITPDGNTRRLPALRHALRLRPDAVFFLTDSDDPMSPREMAMVEELAGGATINAIEFGVGKQTARSNFLIELSQFTGGGYVYVDTQKLGR